MALKMGDDDAAAKDISKLIEILRRQKGGGSYSFTLLMSIVSLCLAYAGERGINPKVSGNQQVHQSSGYGRWITGMRPKAG